MKRIFLLLLLAAGLCGPLAAKSPAARDRELIDRAARWQIRNFTDSLLPKGHWANGALYRGMAEWAAESGDESVWTFLRGIGEACDWDMLERVYDADDLCIGQTYMLLAGRYGDPAMAAKVRERVRYVMSHPDTNPLITPKGKYYRDRWGWCDALFMAPPVYAQLAQCDGRADYLDFCFSEFKVTTDALFSFEDGLYHRDLRLVNDREKNGEKVFWGRGNGWVYAGLALLLQYVPENHPSYAYYLDLFRRMSPAILRCQDAKGSWHAGMYDPQSWPQPENSASGFFVYGFAWGVNNGILTDPAYRKAAVKGWKALKSHVQKDGKLGYVQPIGHDPAHVTAEMTAPYGVGAFLLAAAEMMRMK